MTKRVSGGSVFVPYARGLEYADDREDVYYSPFLSTSDSAFSKLEVLGSEDYSRGAEDQDGPFVIGLRAEKSAQDGTVSKAVIIASEQIFTSSADQVVPGYNMKLFESVILLILRILYDEKKRELSASDEVIVNMGDIHEKFLSLKIRDKMMDKTTLRNAVSTMRRFQLVEVLDRELSNEDSRLIIYDSILMAVRVEDIKLAYEKLENYRKGGKSNEETDESETDQLA